MKRREALKDASMAAMAGAAAMLAGKNEAMAQVYDKATKGLPPLKITKVRAIPTGLGNIFITVKVETSEPGLYGIGDASFQQEPMSVVTAVNEHLDPFCRGKDADNIEDLWQSEYLSQYWRNGPVVNSVLSGMDEALWDIKGKRAGMPLYQLFGGKSRFAIPCYIATYAKDFDQLTENVKKIMAEGYKHIKIHLGNYGGGGLPLKSAVPFRDAGFGLKNDAFQDTISYMRMVPKTFEHVRVTCGEEVELMHDLHERLHPIEAINLIQECEKYRPFFLEDPFSPEDLGYFKILRQRSTCPIAQGENFINPRDWVGLVSERLIDFLRCNTTHIGGITPTLKLCRLAEWFNVRTAWYGGIFSPVGFAANAHIDLAIWNFGIQEERVSKAMLEVFPGSPQNKNGYMFINEAPGLGVDIDEKAAAKFPIKGAPYMGRGPIRDKDGTVIRP